MPLRSPTFLKSPRAVSSSAGSGIQLPQTSQAMPPPQVVVYLLEVHEGLVEIAASLLYLFTAQGNLSQAMQTVADALAVSDLLAKRNCTL